MLPCLIPVSSGKRQRVHEVKFCCVKDVLSEQKIKIEKEDIYVKINTEENTGEKMPSDHYSYMELWKIDRSGLGKVHSSLP
jgi:hypothetical protein